MEQNKGAQTIRLMAAIEEFKQKVASELFRTLKPKPVVAFDLVHCPIKDMPMFGHEQAADDLDFRWPTEADLRELKLTKPPKLTEIRTKGFLSGLSMVQFAFEGGLESTVFDSYVESTKEINLYSVRQGC